MNVIQQQLVPVDQPFWLRAVGVLLALHLLSALVLEASPELHRKIHSKGDSPDHECLVRMLEVGWGEATVVVSLIAVLKLSCFSAAPSRVALLLPAVAFRLFPGRAPPFRFT